MRAFLPATWLARVVGGGPVRGQLGAAAASMPLMLCSCCVTPIFSAVHAERRRFGPAVGLLIGSPSLNPAALALTFALLGATVGLACLVMALLAVLRRKKDGQKRPPHGHADA